MHLVIGNARPFITFASPVLSRGVITCPCVSCLASAAMKSSCNLQPNATAATRWSITTCLKFPVAKHHVTHVPTNGTPRFSRGAGDKHSVALSAVVQSPSARLRPALPKWGPMQGATHPRRTTTQCSGCARSPVKPPHCELRSTHDAVPIHGPTLGRPEWLSGVSPLERCSRAPHANLQAPAWPCAAI